MKKINKLQKKIMRRVYYAFAIRLTTHTITKHVVVLLVAGVLLARLVHVAAVYRNVASVRVGELGSYVFKAVVNADTATLMVLGLIIFTLLSLRFKLRVPSIRLMQTA